MRVCVCVCVSIGLTEHTDRGLARPGLTNQDRTKQAYIGSVCVCVCVPACSARVAVLWRQMLCMYMCMLILFVLPSYVIHGSMTLSLNGTMETSIVHACNQLFLAVLLCFFTDGIMTLRLNGTMGASQRQSGKR